MSAFLAIQTVLDLAVVVLLIWGFLNEDKFIAFEDKLARAIAINIRNHRRRKAVEQKRKLQAQKQRLNNQTAFVQPPALAPQPVKQPARATAYWVA